MKLLFAFIVLLLCSCSSQMYLQSNCLTVTGVALIDGKKVVEVCGINNKNKPWYSYYQTEGNPMPGDTICIR